LLCGFVRCNAAAPQKQRSDMVETALTAPETLLGRKKQRSNTVQTALTAPETQKNRRISTQKNADETKTVSERLLRGFMR
jgi:hypothetical protein